MVGKLRNDFGSMFFRKYGWCISRLGIEFKYKGDTLSWVFWWQREAGISESFLSISYGMYFKSLKEYDEFLVEVKRDLEKYNCKMDYDYLDEFDNEFDVC